MAVKDEKAPAALQVVVLDGNGREWGRMFANQKDFKTGSSGYYASGKINNPGNPVARYQCGLTFTLIGSKETVQA
jgi:hypothetical protein